MKPKIAISKFNVCHTFFSVWNFLIFTLEPIERKKVSSAVSTKEEKNVVGLKTSEHQVRVGNRERESSGSFVCAAVEHNTEVDSSGIAAAVWQKEKGCMKYSYDACSFCVPT
jgi:hypothetical protein